MKPNQPETPPEGNPLVSPDIRFKIFAEPNIGDNIRDAVMIPTVMDKINNKQKLKVKEVTFFCTACTQKFTVNKKDENGNIIKQQVCPHIILEGVR